MERLTIREGISSDREVIQRVMGIDFGNGEDYTAETEIKQEETKDGH